MVCTTTADEKKPDWETTFITSDYVLPHIMGMDIDQHDEAMAKINKSASLLGYAFFLGRPDAPVAIRCSLQGKTFVVTSDGPEPAERPVADLVQSLKDPNNEVRLLAILRLTRRCGKVTPEQKAEVTAAVPALVTALNDSFDDIRFRAIIALGRIGPGAAASATPLDAIVADSGKEEYVRRNAIWSLGKIGPGAKSAVPTLIKVIEAGKELRVHAAGAIWRIEKHPLALPTLTSALSDKDKWVRRDAANTLGEIGPDAVSVVPALVKVFKEDKEELVRESTGESLKKIDPEAAKKAGVP